jgi:hypothetical protein
VAPLVLSLIEFLQLEQLHDLGLHTDVLTETLFRLHQLDGVCHYQYCFTKLLIRDEVSSRKLMGVKLCMKLLIVILSLSSSRLVMSVIPKSWQKLTIW